MFSLLNAVEADFRNGGGGGGGDGEVDVEDDDDLRVLFVELGRKSSL